jgi:hypothetical protein
MLKFSIQAVVHITAPDIRGIKDAKELLYHEAEQYINSHGVFESAINRKVGIRIHFKDIITQKEE